MRRDSSHNRLYAFVSVSKVSYFRPPRMQRVPLRTFLIASPAAWSVDSKALYYNVP